MTKAHFARTQASRARPCRAPHSRMGRRRTRRSPSPSHSPMWSSTWTRSTRSSRLAKCALVTFNHLIFPSQEKIPFIHGTSHPRMGYAIHPIPGWDSCIPSQDGTSHTSHPRMGHSIHPIPGWDSCIPSQDGIFHTSHPRMGLLHPIPGWDIPNIPSQDGIIASHPRMGHPIHPIPGWDYVTPRSGKPNTLNWKSLYAPIDHIRFNIHI